MQFLEKYRFSEVALAITIQSLNDSDYQGTRIVLRGWQEDNKYVTAYFHPNGTLMAFFGAPF